MRKFDNFKACLKPFENVDATAALEDPIVRMGVVGQFNLSFELAWKALQQVTRQYGVDDSRTGSPREIIKLGYKHGFIDDEKTWLALLQDRNLRIRAYGDEDEINRFVCRILETYYPFLKRFADEMKLRVDALESGEA